MALSDVNVRIINGGLGIQPGTGTGLICKVGVSSLGKVGQIVSITDKDQIAAAFGTGPLANGIADSLTGGAKTIYAVRADGDVKGVAGKVTAVKTGTGHMTVSGDPLDLYKVIVRITDAGTFNSAAFQYSLDGGATYAKRITVPADGAYEIVGTGIKLAFTEGEASGQSFAAGDQYSFAATAPTASIASINAAMDVLLDTNITYEGIHICGASDKSLWVALDVRALEAQTRFRYIYIVAEAAAPGVDKDVDSWMAERIAESASFASDRVAVCGAFGKVTDSLTGNQVMRNLAGIMMGRVSALKVQESAGKTMLGSLPGIVELLPAGLNTGHIEALENARYMMARRHEGLNGFYISEFRIMAEAISDYQYGEFRRAMDKACKLVRIAALRFKNYEASEQGIKALEAYVGQPLNTMIGAGEITDGTVSIPPDQDILSTSRIKVKIAIQPVGIMRNIDLEIGLVNPFVNGGELLD